MRVALSPADRASHRLDRTLGWAGIAGVIAVLFVWQLGRIHVFQFSNDEGIILMWTRMARAGYPLYSTTWVDQPPGLMALLMGAFALFGESVTVARVLVLLIGSLGLLAVGLVVREATGWLAAILAVAMLGMSPLFAWYARGVMQDVPALSMASLGLALGLIYRRTGERRWLWLSGAAFGVGLLIKPVVLPLVVPIGFILLAGHRGAKGFHLPGVVAEVVQWAAAMTLLVVLVLAVFDVRAMVRLVLDAILEARGAYAWSLRDNLMRFGELAVDGNLGIIALAGIGAAAVVLRSDVYPAPVENPRPSGPQPKTAGWTMLLWAGMSAAALLIHTPLYAHHLIMFLMPLAALAGTGAGFIAHRIGAALRKEPAQATATLRGWALIGILAVAVYAGSIPRMVRAYADEISRFEALKWQALDQLRDVTDPGDFIVTDMGIIAFRARLLTPPNTVDMGGKRVASGLLTDQDVLEAALAYPTEAVVFWTSRQRLVPDFAAWVDHNYYHLFEDGASRHIYVPYNAGPVVHYASPSLQVAPATTVDAQRLPVQLGTSVALLGYTVAQSSVAAGNDLHLTLLWAARDPVQGSYKVFTHLVDAADEIWGQKDNLPVERTRPTDTWKAGELIVDNYAIPVDPLTPPGRYVIEVGMYMPDTGERLSVLAANSQPVASRILLEPITVEDREPQ